LQQHVIADDSGEADIGERVAGEERERDEAGDGCGEGHSDISYIRPTTAGIDISLAPLVL
jgi:hypothetical protein